MRSYSYTEKKEEQAEEKSRYRFTKNWNFYDTIKYPSDFPLDKKQRELEIKHHNRMRLLGNFNDMIKQQSFWIITWFILFGVYKVSSYIYCAYISGMEVFKVISDDFSRYNFNLTALFIGPLIIDKVFKLREKNDENTKNPYQTS